jgi:hypothetical protein
VYTNDRQVVFQKATLGGIMHVSGGCAAERSDPDGKGRREPAFSKADVEARYFDPQGHPLVVHADGDEIDVLIDRSVPKKTPAGVMKLLVRSCMNR